MFKTTPIYFCGFQHQYYPITKALAV